MDSYSPNPANDPLTIQVPDDITDLWTASVINAPTESLADSIAYLRQRAGWLSSSNWPHGLALWAGTQVDAGLISFTLGTPPVWDSAYGRWLGGFINGSSNTQILQSADGYSWVPLVALAGGSGNKTLGVAARSTDGLVLIFYIATGGTPMSAVFTPIGGSSSSSTPGWMSDPGAGNWITAGWVSVSSVWACWQGGSSTVHPQWSPDGLTWTAATTWSPPSGFTIHTRAHVNTIYAGTQYLIIFPSGTTVVSACMLSTDGKNWASVAMPSLAAGESVIDATFDAFTGTLYLLTGTSSVTHLWSSPITTISWMLASTLNHQSFGMHANGREILVWAAVGSYLSSTGGGYIPIYRGIVTLNGGVTWATVPIAASYNPPGNYFAIRGNGNQFLYINTTEYASSLSAGPAPGLGV